MLFLIILIVLSVCSSGLSVQDKNDTQNITSVTSPELPDEGANRILRNYWERTFKEIKDLEVLFPQTSPLLNQWKSLLDEEEESDPQGPLISNASTIVSGSPMTKRNSRFEGFRSWDRLLQEWADDVAEYLQRNSLEGASYPLSTFGMPRDSETEDFPERNGDQNEELVVQDVVASTSEAATPMTRPLPVPRPVQPGQAVVPHTDLADKSKSVWIVTTAALPWMTGTAVNPLLQAAYLTRGRDANKVTLMLPWLEDISDQERVYGSRRFDSPADQEHYIRTWLQDSAGLVEESRTLKIAWYTARQERAENSIYSMGDITALIPSEEVDICILIEPEHLNWYRGPGESWTTKFQHVVGIIHTNYFVYAQEQPAAFVRAPAMRLLCSWMCRAHCHRIIKLSGTLGKFAPEKELVENVHGVRGTFLDAGREVRKILTSRQASQHPVFAADASPSIYFIGKMLWSKGFGSLMELLTYAQESAGLDLHVDMYGGGPDLEAVAAKSKKLGLDLEFHGPLDHSKLSLTHKIFINPSTSEVLCTTTAEALAMGKFVVLPSHPSNDFFAQFPNCLPYTTQEEFLGNLYYALTHSPEPMSDEYARAFTWEAATERLEAAASVSVEEAKEMALAFQSQDAGVEIDLPPLIDDLEQRQRIASTFRSTRRRYRQFRSRLSEELKQSKVLPKELQRRLTLELDRRLDLDIEKILESPKLRLQLSPAELDKRLLDIYNEVSRSPSGDILRLIGGGTNVGLQNLYMQRQASKQRRLERLLRKAGKRQSLFEDETNPQDRTPTQWVTWALRRNLPPASLRAPSLTTSSSSSHPDETKRKSPSMLLAPSFHAALKRDPPRPSWMGSPLI